MRLRTPKACFAAQNIDIEAATQVSGAQYDLHQIAFLNKTERFAIDVKARQIAWSFTAALDAVCDGVVEPNTPHIFVSITLDEAREKVRYAKSIVDAFRPSDDWPIDALPTLVRDSLTELEFDNGSRLISHPCRPPRGKARARIYLDEMAHYKSGLDREIYTAALPATVRGDGYIRIGSSPLGASGLFWEIATESMRRYPGYKRRVIPWWHVRHLCKDIKTAKQVAPDLTTKQRVYAFGTDALIAIFENSFIEDFQQEHECAWVDEATAWISWEVIQQNQDDNLLWWHAENLDDAYHMLAEVQQAIARGKIESVFVGGIDVGRKHDLTEFVIVGRDRRGVLPIRFCISLNNVEFDKQQALFWRIITALPFTVVLIDQNGIGMQLAENLSRTGRAAGVDFTGPNKELFAVEARIQAERKNTPLPQDRDLAYQIHSIKKMVTAAKHNRFDTERNEKHHADKFWGWSLAIFGASAVNRIRDQQVEVVDRLVPIGPSF